MKYKALMLDVDGTLVPYEYSALPSERVVRAIKKAQKVVTVCLVTGRSYGFTKHVLKRLDIHAGFVVANNGASVLEIPSENILYDQPITAKTLKDVLDILFKENVDFYLKPDIHDLTYQKGFFPQGKTADQAYALFTEENLPSKKVDAIFKKLAHIPDLTLHKQHHKHPNKFGFSISHVNATKLHGIQIVMKKYGLKKEELIGVGDSYNDFPLLMACGLKVAMGNAVSDLKEIADHIAPHVDDDGVVEVIEKFILKTG